MTFKLARRVLGIVTMSNAWKEILCIMLIYNLSRRGNSPNQGSNSPTIGVKFLSMGMVILTGWYKNSISVMRNLQENSNFDVVSLSGICTLKHKKESMKTFWKFNFIISTVFILMVITGLAFSDKGMLMNFQDPSNIACFDKWEASVNARNQLLPSETNKTDRGIPGYSVNSQTILWYHRSQEEGLEIFMSPISNKKALRATIADGRRWEGHKYDRAELLICPPVGGTLTTGHKYEISWTGYIEKLFPPVREFVAAMQLHGNDNASPANGIYVRDTMVTFRDRHGAGFYNVISTSEMLNKAITFRMTITPSDSAGYLKFEYKKEGSGWVSVMEKSSGRTQNPGGNNYMKIGGLYDYYNDLVSPDQYSRGRSYSLVTMNATLAEITGEGNHTLP